MTLIRPDFSSIYSTLYTDVSTGLGSVPIAQFSILGSLSRALSRALDAVYGYCDNAFLNSVPWTATGTNASAWAAMWGIVRLAPTGASGYCTMTFNGPATIPMYSNFVGANGVSYYSVFGDVVVGGGVTFPYAQQVGLLTNTTGAITDLAAGAVVTLTSPIANVVPSGVIGSMTGGMDPETDQALFARAQQARSEPPQGGSQGDYIVWSEAAMNVTRCWVQPTPAQPGNVIVYIMVSSDNGNNGFPVGTDGCSQYETRGPVWGVSAASGDQQTVADYIWPLRPVTSFVNVVAPVAYPINGTITNTNPNTVVSQAAVLAALEARFLEIGTPFFWNGTDWTGMVIQQSDLTVAINGVLTSYDLTGPSFPITLPLGTLPTVGTSWTFS